MKSVFRRVAASAMLCGGLVAPAWAQVVIPAGGRVDVLPGAGMEADCAPVQLEGTLRIDTGQVATRSHFNVAATGVLDLDAGTLSVGGDLTSTGSVHAGAGTVVLTDGCTGNTTRLSGTLVFQNLVLSSTTGRTFVIPAGGHITVLSHLTLQGAQGQDIRLASSDGSTAAIQLGAGATVQRNFAVVAGNVQIGAAVPPGAVQGIPTLGEYGRVLLALLVAAVALLLPKWQQRRIPKAVR